MENAEKLIDIVHSMPPLWDMKDRRYHLRDVQRTLWRKVADHLGLDVEAVKKKWKGLRDTFRREYKKKFKSGQEAEDLPSQWPYFNQMLFLTDTVKPRELKGSLTSTVNELIEEECVQFTQSGEEDEDLQLTMETENVNIQPIVDESALNKEEKKKTVKRTRKTEDNDDQFLQIEREKLKLFSESTTLKGDSDYQFLLSLLPYLKKVAEPRKLYVRQRLQQVLLDEEERSFQITQMLPGPSTSRPQSSVSAASYCTSPGESENWGQPQHGGLGALTQIQHLNDSFTDMG